MCVCVCVCVCVCRVSQEDVYTHQIAANQVFIIICFIFNMQMNLTTSFCRFVIVSQIDVHSSPDTADNAKRWSSTHHEEIPSVFACIHVQ